MLTIEDAICKLCRAGSGQDRETCPMCHGTGYVMEGCCSEDEEEDEDRAQAYRPSLPRTASPEAVRASGVGGGSTARVQPN